MAKIIIQDNGQLEVLKKFLNDKRTPNTVPLAKKAVEGACRGAMEKAKKEEKK